MSVRVARGTAGAPACWRWAVSFGSRRQEPGPFKRWYVVSPRAAARSRLALGEGFLREANRGTSQRYLCDAPLGIQGSGTSRPSKWPATDHVRFWARGGLLTVQRSGFVENLVTVRLQFRVWYFEPDQNLSTSALGALQRPMLKKEPRCLRAPRPRDSNPGRSPRQRRWRAMSVKLASRWS